MNMERVFGKARSLWALTSLDRVELARLEEGPGEAPGQRTGPGGGTTACHASGRCGADGPGKLPTTRARLLFLLFCFKCYPLQEVLAFLFGMSQPQACEWIQEAQPRWSTGRWAGGCSCPSAGPPTRTSFWKPCPRCAGWSSTGWNGPCAGPRTGRSRRKTTAARRKPTVRRIGSFPASSGWRTWNPLLRAASTTRSWRMKVAWTLSARCAGAQGHGLPGRRTASLRPAPAREETTRTRIPSHPEPAKSSTKRTLNPPRR